jgi:hypothetical protein
LTTRSTTASVSPCRARTADERGTGIIGTLFGVTAFLLFLLFAVQVLLGLYTTTVVTSATTDAAAELSHRADPVDVGAQREVQDHALARLGAFARQPGRVTFDWEGTDPDTVVLAVHARKMTLLPRVFGGALSNRIDRTVRVRVERVR